MSAHFWYSDNCINPDSEDAFTEEEIEEIVELVRESSFLDDTSGKSIDERMTDVFGGRAPEWSGFQTAEGICCVNCGGVLSDGSEQLGVVIQFEIAEDLESFVFSGMLVNGVEQPEGLIMQFEEQFSSELWQEYDGDEDEWYDEEDDSLTGSDPLSLFLREDCGSTIVPEIFWGEDPDSDRLLESLWDDDEDYDEEDDCGDDCDCGHGHHHDHCGEHHHHHDHYGCACEDDDDDDDGAGWDEAEAAERFWYENDDSWDDGDDGDCDY